MGQPSTRVQSPFWFLLTRIDCPYQLFPSHGAALSSWVAGNGVLQMLAGGAASQDGTAFAQKTTGCFTVTLSLVLAINVVWKALHVVVSGFS